MTSFRNFLYNEQKKMQNLLESIRFGQSQIRELFDYDDELRIGFEFEMVIDDEYAGVSDYSSVTDMNIGEIRRIDPALVHKVESDLLDDFLARFEDEYSVSDFRYALNEFIKIVENTDFDKLVRYKNSIIEEKENYDTYEELYDDHEGFFEYLFRHFKKIAFTKFIRDFDDHYRNMRGLTSEEEYLDDNDINIEAMIDNAAEIEEFTRELRSFLSDIETIDDFKEQLESFVDDILEHIDYDEAVSALDTLTDFTDNIHELLEEAVKMQVRNELREHVIDYIIEQDLEYRFIKESAVEFVKTHLGNKGYIDEVVSDESLGDQGAEAVTYPIPPSEIDSVVKEVCDFINTYGITKESTGLHYNISLTRADFNLDNFNMLKFLLLLDEGYVAHDFGRTISSYAVQMQSQLDNEVIIEEAINAFIENGISGLEDVSEKYLTNKPGKFDGINILNLSTGANLGQNRIEVRYPGGSYSDEPNKVIWHAYRMLYTLMTAFNEDFKREEYLRALYDFWSDVTEGRYDMDFAEAIRRYRHHGTLSPSDE